MLETEENLKQGDATLRAMDPPGRRSRVVAQFTHLARNFAAKHWFPNRRGSTMSRVSSTFDLGEQVYHRIVEHGESLDQVEQELIGPARDVNEEQRAALWLYAWSLQSAAHQRYQSRRFLEELERAQASD
jgi:hypothetical protein